MTTNEIRTAYEKIGLNPCKDDYYVNGPDGGLCCPLTALAIASGDVSVSDPQLDHKTRAWAVAKWGEPWVLGFQDGWDWRWPGKSAPVADPGYRNGFEAGKSALKSLVFIDKRRFRTVESRCRASGKRGGTRTRRVRLTCDHHSHLSQFPTRSAWGKLTYIDHRFWCSCTNLVNGRCFRGQI